MAELPRVPRRMGLVTQAPNYPDPGLYGSPFAIIGQALDDLGDTLRTEEKDQAKAAAPEAAARAITKDADGNLRVTLVPEVDDATRLQNRLARQGYAARITPEVANQIGNIRRQNEGKPDVFRQAAEEYRDALVGQQPDAQLGQAVSVIVDREIAQHWGGLLDAKDKRDLEVNVAGIKGQLATLDNELAAIARQGGASGPEYAARAKQYADLWRELSGNPRVAVSPQESERAIRRTQDRHRVEAFIGHIDRTYSDNRNGGLKKAEEEAERFLWDSSLDLDPADRRQYYTIAIGQLRVRRAEANAAAKEARERVSEMVARYRAGMDVPETEFDELLNAARDAGAAGAAARLLATRAMHKLFKPMFDGLNDREQAQWLETARRGPGSLEEVLARQESSNRPGIVNRYGYAGLFQFGAPRLNHLGLYTPGPNENLQNWKSDRWTGVFRIDGHPDVRTLDDFLKSPEAQRAAFRVHISKMDEEIRRAGLNRYEGKTIDGVQITHAGLQAMIHFGGLGGAKAFLESGGSQDRKDANGASVGDYARLGAGASASITPEMVTYWRKEVKSDAESIVASVETAARKGITPSADEIDLLRMMLPIVTDDRDLQDRVTQALGLADFGREFAQQPIAAQEAAESQLAGEIAAGGGNQVQQIGRDLARSIRTETLRGLNEDPLGLLESRGQLRAPIGPLDFSNREALVAELARREANVAFIRAFHGRSDAPALRPAELEAFKGFMRAPSTTASEKVGLLSALRGGLSEQSFLATMARIGQDQNASLLAFAGGLLDEAPVIAESILRGETVIQANADHLPKRDEEYRSALQEAFPTNTLAPGMERAHATITKAVEARYADLSAQAGDTSAVLEADRLERAVADVTGGVVEWHSGKVIVPRRGMQGDEFNLVVLGIADADLEGVQTAAGTPIRAADLRRSIIRLRTVADGVYHIEFDDPSRPGQPSYAVVRRSDGRGFEKFKLDLKGRRPVNPNGDEATLDWRDILWQPGQ